MIFVFQIFQKGRHFHKGMVCDETCRHGTGHVEAIRCNFYGE